MLYSTLDKIALQYRNVQLKNLAAYFEKRARENHNRSNKLEKEKDTFKGLDERIQDDRSSYYFSGKADSYKRAAQKVREILG